MQNPNKELLERHLTTIIGERAPGFSDGHLANVFGYIQECLEKLGYTVELDPFSFQGNQFKNIIAKKSGSHSRSKIIVGAHFDSVPGSPGADDNASGVAAMLELARVLINHNWNHDIEFVGFHLEEWAMIGSQAYAEKLKRSGAQIKGMVSLEMVGYTSQEPKSQKMPAGFGLFYPSVGNFIGLVGNTKSSKLVKLFKTKMKEVKGLPVESLLMPFNGILLPATRWSDHSPFWDLGYPALMITDTSFYRNPHYHSAADALDTLDLDFMLKVTDGVAKALIALDES